MRLVFLKCVRYYSFKAEEINKQELRAWNIPVVAKFIKEKLGITVEYLKIERIFEENSAYFDCVLHKKSQYMAQIDDFFNFDNDKDLIVQVTMRGNGVECQCLVPDKFFDNEKGISKDEAVVNEILNFEALKELEIMFNKKREEIIQNENSVKQVFDEIQKLADQIINF